MNTKFLMLFRCSKLLQIKTYFSTCIHTNAKKLKKHFIGLMAVEKWIDHQSRVNCFLSRPLDYSYHP